jgi:hypothetical protein
MSTNAIVRIAERGGLITSKTFNEQIDGSQWIYLGAYTFGPPGGGTGGYVETVATNGQVSADAIKWLKR